MFHLQVLTKKNLDTSFSEFTGYDKIFVVVQWPQSTFKISLSTGLYTFLITRYVVGIILLTDLSLLDAFVWSCDPSTRWGWGKKKMACEPRAGRSPGREGKTAEPIDIPLMPPFCALDSGARSNWSDH